MKKKIALVVGTRPEAIKMAPIWFTLKQSKVFQPLLISTGQHREMLGQALEVFGIKPDIELDLMLPSQTLTQITSRVMIGVSQVLREHMPSAVLVQGDTATVLAASVASFYEKVPVGHIEAGLRTYNLNSPWPEEMNRRLTDPISRWCFAPTEWSAANLRAERIEEGRIEVTGNTVVDSLLWVREKIARSGVVESDFARRCNIPEEFAQKYLWARSFHSDNSVQVPNLKDKKWILVTGHRRESFGAGFDGICRALLTLTNLYPEMGIIYPVHLNPNVQGPIRRLLGSSPQIALIPPVGYEEFIWLMDKCHFILSDSGGVQEEAPSLGKPVLVMRETTERPEGVAAGTCRLVGTCPDRIISECKRLLGDAAEYARRSALVNPYGTGDASMRIVRVLERDLATR